MRLIDADALKGKMYHDAFETDTDMQKWDGGCWIRYKLFENNIDNAPTIDVPDRKVGKWILGDSGQFKGVVSTCSVCGKRYLLGNIDYNYCPNCGADMRGK